MAILYFLFEVLCALIFSGMCVGLLLIGTIALAFLLFEEPELEPRTDVMVSMIICLAIIILLIYHF